MKKIAVEVVDAAGLMPKDGRGSASPFVEVEFDGQCQRTQTKLKDLNPTWNEILFCNVADSARLPHLTITVSVYHERSRSPSASAAGYRPQFLGRVRLSGVSVAPSPDEAVVNRYPLKKRALISNIRGDISLRVYTLPDSGPSGVPDVTHAVRADGQLDPLLFASEQVPIAAAEPKKAKKAAASVAPDEPRVFYSVPTAAPGGVNQMCEAASGAPPPVSVAIVAHARAEAAAPASAVVVRPPVMVRPGPDYGLIDTAPPLASRLGYRGSDKIASTYDRIRDPRRDCSPTRRSSRKALRR